VPNCTDEAHPGDEYAYLRDAGLTMRKSTYAAAARALLADIKRLHPEWENFDVTGAVMTRSEIDRRAYRTVPIQYAGEAVYERGDKHAIRCDCSQCSRCKVREGSPS
jgi:hypothetical protein